MAATLGKSDPFENADPFADLKQSESQMTRDIELTDSFQELELTNSKLDTVDAVINREVELRIQIHKLEEEAEAKKAAAKTALKEAMLALDTLNRQSSTVPDEDPSKNKSINGAIDTITIMIKEAQKETAEEINQMLGRMDTLMLEAQQETAEDIRQMVAGMDTGADTAVTESTAVLSESEAATEDSGRRIRPRGFSPDEEEAIEADEDDANEPPDLAIVTSNLSMESVGGNDVVPTREEREERYAETMDSALDAIMDKIEDCNEILSDPASTTEEQIAAAQMASQYAKAAKAFQIAM